MLPISYSFMREKVCLLSLVEYKTIYIVKLSRDFCIHSFIHSFILSFFFFLYCATWQHNIKYRYRNKNSTNLQHNEVKHAKTHCGCDIAAGAYYTVVAWSSVRRTFGWQWSTGVLLARDAQPTSAADDRGHRELVKETEGQAGESAARDVSGRGQRLRGWQRRTCQCYLVHCRPHTSVTSLRSFCYCWLCIRLWPFK